MAILLHLDDILAERGCSVSELAAAVGITRANMSHIKNGSIKALRFSTLDKICDYLDCQPGDLLEFAREKQPVWNDSALED